METRFAAEAEAEAGRCGSCECGSNVGVVYDGRAAHGGLHNAGDPDDDLHVVVLGRVCR